MRSIDCPFPDIVVPVISAMEAGFLLYESENSTFLSPFLKNPQSEQSAPPSQSSFLVSSSCLKNYQVGSKVTAIKPKVALNICIKVYLVKSPNRE